jgi:hypothetical protein
LSGYDCPNIKVDAQGNYYEVRPKPFPFLVDLGWIEKQIRNYGREDPRVVSRVFGEFPSAAVNQLLDDKILANAIAKGTLLRKIVSETGVGDEVVAPDVFENRN